MAKSSGRGYHGGTIPTTGRLEAQPVCREEPRRGQPLRGILLSRTTCGSTVDHFGADMKYIYVHRIMALRPMPSLHALTPYGSPYRVNLHGIFVSHADCPISRAH